jgi:hypothetical protein
MKKEQKKILLVILGKIMALEEIELVNIKMINLKDGIKIQQENNFNSYSSLFIVDNEVIKIYTDQYDKVKFNIITLKSLFEKEKYLRKIKEFVLPNKLIKHKNNIVGFSMPYIKGLTLEKIINNNSCSEKEIKEIFIKILKVIIELSKLPFDFCLADLHEKNVIVDSNKNIHLIDCDGFVIDDNQMVIDGSILMGKYLEQKNKDEDLNGVNVSGDYFCLLCIVINYIFKNKIHTIDDLKDFSEYLDDKYLNKIITRASDIKNFKLTQSDIEMLFSQINYYNEKYETYQNDIEKLLEVELIRIRKKNNSLSNFIVK